MEHTHIENVKNFSTENSRALTSDYVNKLNAIYCMQIILNEITLVKSLAFLASNCQTQPKSKPKQKKPQISVQSLGVTSWVNCVAGFADRKAD